MSRVGVRTCFHVDVKEDLWDCPERSWPAFGYSQPRPPLSMVPALQLL